MPNFFHEPKISQLNRSLLLNEHVLRLNVSMEKAMIVDIIESAGYLVDNVTYLFVRERIIVQVAHLHHSVQVHIEQLE